MQQKLIALCLFIGIWGPIFDAKPEAVASALSVEMRVGDEGFLSSWLTLGPMPSSELDSISAALTQTAPFSGARQGGRKWTVSHFASSAVDLSAKRKSAAALFVRISTDANRTVLLSTGSNGPIQIVLNRKTVQSRNVPRKCIVDTDLTRLLLQKGDNDLFIIVKNEDVQRLQTFVRFLDEDFSPALSLRVLLPGESTDVSQITTLKATPSLIRKIDFSKKAFSIRPQLRFPGGYPKNRPAVASVRFNPPEAAENFAGEVKVGSDVGSVVDLGEYRFGSDPLPAEVSFSIGSGRFSKPVGVRFKDLSRLIEADENLNAAKKARPIEKTTFESLSWRIAHLKTLIEAGDPDAMYINREIQDTVRMTESLKNGSDPYFNRRGRLQRRGYRSSIDGSLQPYGLYVPPSWREEGEGRYALLVALHGLNSTPMKTLQSVFGIPLAEGQTKQEQGRHPVPVSPVPMFVLAPGGFGNSNYRAFGEKDVLDAVEQVASRYRINPDRIYITGASMGGIGAASLPLHYPGLFAAAAPLCGYHSMFLYRGLVGRAFLPFERFLLESHSNAFWAENGRHLPLYIVHGLKDRPAQSRVLVNAYRDAGYSIAYETPDLGHNVWDLTYQNGRIFSHFAPLKRETHPREVTFRTSTLRYTSAYYLQIDQMEHFDRFSKVDSNWRANDTIIVQTQNVAALTIINDESLKGEAALGPLSLQIDGTSIPLPRASLDWRLKKEAGLWHLVEKNAKPEGLHKRQGLSGPIDDAQFDSLLMVYGTMDKAEEFLSKRLLRQMAGETSGVTIHRPIKADHEVTDEDLKTHSVVIVGTPKGNALLGKMADALPIQIREGAVVVGQKKFEGWANAAAFIYPNPLNPDRYVVVYTGTSLEALYYINHLPGMLPDYIVFDGSTWPTKNGRILDSRPFLTAGFFDGSWEL